MHDATYWVVEHAYPTSLAGWLVIVLKRHAEALHELTCGEGEELGLLQWAVSRALAAETGCLKEYSIFFAEQPRFSHVHVHMVPRAKNLDPELMGGRIFAQLKPSGTEVIDPSEVAKTCARMGHVVRALLESPD